MVSGYRCPCCWLGWRAAPSWTLLWGNTTSQHSLNTDQSLVPCDHQKKCVVPCHTAHVEARVGRWHKALMGNPLMTQDNTSKVFKVILMLKGSSCVRPACPPPSEGTYPRAGTAETGACQTVRLEVELGSPCPPCPRGQRAKDAATPKGTKPQDKAGEGPN